MHMRWIVIFLPQSDPELRKTVPGRHVTKGIEKISTCQESGRSYVEATLTGDGRKTQDKRKVPTKREDR